MKELNEKTAGKMLHPERVIQFGEGNFMRAFVDFFIDNMNEKADCSIDDRHNKKRYGWLLWK